MNAGASLSAVPSPIEGSGTAWVLLGSWALSPARPTPIPPRHECRGFSALLVTFDEDNIKTTSANQAQGMGCLRSVAMRLLRRFNVKNFQEALEDFADCPSRFEALLRRVKFL